MNLAWPHNPPMGPAIEECLAMPPAEGNFNDIQLPKFTPQGRDKISAHPNLPRAALSEHRGK